eukprot:scaffold58740_cov51-Phaeocystis_antarctica.AAC.3
MVSGAMVSGAMVGGAMVSAAMIGGEAVDDAPQWSHVEEADGRSAHTTERALVQLAARTHRDVRHEHEAHLRRAHAQPDVDGGVARHATAGAARRRPRRPLSEPP